MFQVNEQEQIHLNGLRQEAELNHRQLISSLQDQLRRSKLLRSTLSEQVRMSYQCLVSSDYNRFILLSAHKAIQIQLACALRWLAFHIFLLLQVTEDSGIRELMETLLQQVSYLY